MNLSEILSQYVEVEKSGQLHSCCCPFHPDDKKSMRINDAKDMFKCFFCGAGGDAISFVEKFKKISREEALIEVREMIQKFISSI